MYDLDDLYGHEQIVVLKKRFLLCTNNNYCAACFLDIIWACRSRRIGFNSSLAYFEEDQIQPIDGPFTFNIERIPYQLLGMFSPETVREAIAELEKQYIIYDLHLDTETSKLTFCVNGDYVAQISKEYFDELMFQRMEQYRNSPPTSTQEETKPGPQAPKKHKNRHLKEQARLRHNNTKAKEMGLQGTLILDDWLETLHHFNWACAYCGGKYQLLEHFVPLTMGGHTSKANCVPACYSCNSIKGPYHPDTLPSKIADQMKPAIEKVRAFLCLCESEVGDE